MKKVLIIGEVLVEIMADTIGDGFLTEQPLRGPFPSGAPAIFADQLAKLGQSVALISCVGDDDFGRLNINRLQQDGVDTSGIHTDTDRPTGSAFVRYRSDGSRDFVFNIRHSACGVVNPTRRVKELISECNHVHVMGSSFSSPEFIQLNLETVQEIKAKGGTVSFDPNLRKEMLSSPGLGAAMDQILKMTDLFLPSGSELTLLTRTTTPEAAIKEILSLGVQAIVHKNGASGARYIDSEMDISAPAFSVQEIDPTGAGDSFGGAFTACWLAGQSPHDALRVATAAGALAVTKKGPMEGTSTLPQIQTFLKNSEKR